MALGGGAELCRKFHTLMSSWSPHNDHPRSVEFSSLEDVKAELRKAEGGLVTSTRDESDGLAYIYFENNSKKNGLTGKMMVDLNEIVAELEGWSDGKGVILHSHGDIFCSGGDASQMRKFSAPQQGVRMARLMHDTATRLRHLPMVSVAVVQGMALGGGAELMLFTDFRLLTPETQVCYIHSRMGVTAAWGGGTLLKQLVGHRKALDIFLSAKKIETEEAVAMGLADGIVERDRRLEEAVAWLKLRVGPLSADITRAIKRNVLSSGFEEEREILASVWSGTVEKHELLLAPRRSTNK